MTNIHPTAIIDQKSKIGKNVQIGPFCVIGANVELGDNVILKSHVVIDGHTAIGSGTEIFPFASIGLAPQDKKYAGEESKLSIGKNNIIREYVTINPGTKGGGMVTNVGDNCLLMIGCHVAHDCKIGNHVIMANNATLAGHVEIGDYAILGGLSAVHQFVRVGMHAMIGGMAAIEGDVIPYGIALNERASLVGINLVGLKRRDFERDNIMAIKKAYEILFEGEMGKNFAEKIEQVANIYQGNADVMKLVEFLKIDTTRAICKPKNS